MATMIFDSEPMENGAKLRQSMHASVRHITHMMLMCVDS